MARGHDVLLIMVVALVGLVPCIAEVSANYHVQMIAHEYKHLDLKLWDGNCCSSNCSHPCNSTFRFCLQEEECTLGDGCPCTHGVISTDHFPLNVSSVAFAVGEKHVDNVSNPLIFDLMQWKGSLRMKIEVRHKDGFNGYKLIDEVHINEKLNIDTLFSSPSYYGGVRHRVRLRLSFRVLCSEHCASLSANCSIDCHANSQDTNELTAFDIVGTSDCILSDGASSSIGCESLSGNIRTKRETNTVPTTAGSTFYIGFIQNYMNAELSNATMNKSMVFIVADATKNVELRIASHYEQLTTAITKRSLFLSYDFMIISNRKVQSVIHPSNTVQLQSKLGIEMTLFVINEEYTSVDGYTALPFRTVSGVNQYHYYAVSVPRGIKSPTANSAFLIIACVHHTMVTITPSQIAKDPINPNRTLTTGESRTFVLDELDTLYFASPEDLTGSHVVSDQPISFISGHECGSVPYGRVQCNHLVEQIPPTALWGKQFFISSISLHPGGDIFKMVASSNNTAVNIACTSSKRVQKDDINVLIPNAGASINVTIEPADNCIITSKNPILVVQFAPLDSTTIMVTVPATHQYLNTHRFTTVYAGNVEFKHYMKIFVSQKNFNPSLIKLDGETVAAAWHDVMCKEGTACGHVGLVMLTGGAHVVSHDNKGASIGAIVYGISQHESYGYVSSMLLSPLKDTDMNVVIVHPKFTSYVVNVGQKICFECNTKPSTSEAHQFISWSVNTVTPGVETSRMPNGTLCIDQVTAGHTGSYKCKVGADSITYTLSVRVGITVTTPPPPPSPDVATIGIGMNEKTYVDSTKKRIIYIYCPLEGLEDTPTWFANDTMIHQGRHYTVTREYLRVEKPAFGCTTYQCKITFASYTYAESSTLCVRDFLAPTNLTILGPSTVLEGKRFYLECTVQAFPEATITWGTKSGGLPENGITNFGNGTIKLRLLEGNETTFCCTAANVKSPSARNCIKITLILLPHIKKPSSRRRRPGDCKDVTNEKIVHEHVGINLCYHTSSILYLHCVTDRGNPKPRITWRKDGSNLPKAVKLLNNGTTLLFQNTKIDLQAEVDGLPTVGGNYTCMAANPSGTVTASSVIIPIGEISQDIMNKHFIPLQEDLYKQIHLLISNNTSGTFLKEKHVVLMGTAKPLFFEDFDPGKLFDGSEKSMLPRTMENMFHLVNIIPNSLPLLEGATPLYESYQTLINNLVPTTRSVTINDAQKATLYLKELVTDLDQVHMPPKIPRLSLYLQYKERYSSKALDVKRELEVQRGKLSHEEYSDWYASKGVLLESERDGLYMKWETLGDKSGVEKRLALLDLQDHVKPLNDLKAILEASKKNSVLHDNGQYMPVQFVPRNWCHLYLKKSVEETSDQVQYYYAMLKAKLVALEQAEIYVKSQGRQKYKFAPDILLDDAEHTLINEVQNNEKQKYQCILTRGPLECQRYSLEVNSVTHLMDQYASAYWATEQYKGATSTDNMVDAIQDSIVTLKKKMKNLEMIANLKAILAGSKELAKHNTMTADHSANDKESLMFVYNSTSGVKGLSNSRFPVIKRLLWYASSDTTSEYTNTINLLNSASFHVNAKIVKVDVSRRWLKTDVFADSRFQMEKHSLTSPGLLPLEQFAKLIRNGSYHFPLYPSAILLATNIQISIKVPVPFHVMPSLLKMSYDQSFRGGFGPFVIGHKFFPGAHSNVKFLVEQRETDLLMTLPDAQLIGYICSVVPKVHLSRVHSSDESRLQDQAANDNSSSENPHEVPATK